MKLNEDRPKIVIGADHRGFEYKQHILETIKELQGKRILWVDVGSYNDERSDYPWFAYKVTRAIRIDKVATFGILICGSGIGMAVAANRFDGIYAGVAWNIESARIGREHDKTNVLVIPSDFVPLEQVQDMIYAWLTAEFKGGRYQYRIEMIDQLKNLV